MQLRRAPEVALDALGCASHQAADGILHTAYVAARIDNLCLHVQVRRLHLIDCGRVRLAVFPKCLLGVQRDVPEAVGLRQDIQLSVEQLQHVVLLGCGRDEVGTHHLFAHLCLLEHGLCGTFLIGDGAKHVKVHRHLQRQVVGLAGLALVKAGYGALWSK